MAVASFLLRDPTVTMTTRKKNLYSRVLFAISTPGESQSKRLADCPEHNAVEALTVRPPHFLCKVRPMVHKALRCGLVSSVPGQFALDTCRGHGRTDASMLAPLSSLGSASMLTTDSRIFSTDWTGLQRSELQPHAVHQRPVMLQINICQRSSYPAEVIGAGSGPALVVVWIVARWMQDGNAHAAVGIDWPAARPRPGSVSLAHACRLVWGAASGRSSPARH